MGLYPAHEARLLRGAARARRSRGASRPFRERLAGVEGPPGDHMHQGESETVVQPPRRRVGNERLGARLTGAERTIQRERR